MDRNLFILLPIALVGGYIGFKVAVTDDFFVANTNLKFCLFRNLLAESFLCVLVNLKNCILPELLDERRCVGGWW